jgi:release factor glutamine methyltransferase
MIYEPREDSFLLEKYVKQYAKGKVLDMGTGSGIQAFAAKEKTNDVLAVDINDDAVELVKKKGIRAVKSDLFENVFEKFDLITFNLPYLPKEDGEDPEVALQVTGGMEGNELFKKFIIDVGSYLNEDGKILVVVSSLTPDIEEIISDHNFKFEILEEKKMFMESLKVLLLSR